MNRLNRIIGAIREWLHNWFIPPYKTTYVKDLPKVLDQKTLYIIKDDGFIEHASLICPCGCGALLHMNLIPDERPAWQILEYKNGTVSLKPSVWRKIDCKSHFFFIRGRIHWCKNQTS